MTDKPTDGSKSDPRTGDWEPGTSFTDITGDPGVGGLMSDPLDPSPPAKRPAPDKDAPASSDPAPPEAHGDWLPTHKPE